MVGGLNMTENQIKEGQKLLDKIAELKKFYNIYNNGYVKSLLGYNDGNEKVSYHIDEDLRLIIADYLKNKLNKLEKELELL
jgi:hypothetical protein